jgi:hypothetical protein
MVSGHYAANVTALSLYVLFDPLFPLKFRLRLFNRIQGGAPFASATLAAATYIRSGQAPYQGPSCNNARAQGSKGGWDHSVSRRLSAILNTDHTSNLGIGIS